MRDHRPTLIDWEMARAVAGSIDDAAGLDAASLDWSPVRVPGTVAGAWREAGHWGPDDHVDFDADDWWFRTTFAATPTDRAHLRFAGLATVADVWCNGRLVLGADNMFVEHLVEVSLEATNDVVVCCRSLQRHLAARRPRPRWKTRLVEQQQLRWVRTTLLGRMPSWTPPAAPVGIWRPVEVLVDDAPRTNITTLRATYADGIGVLDVAAIVDSEARPTAVALGAGDIDVPLEVTGTAGAWTVSGRLEDPDAEPWWPHSHGEPARENALLHYEIDGRRCDVPLGRIGYRTVTVDDADGAFGLELNGEPVFCRGACWVPLDVISLQAEPCELRRALERVRAAGMNMVRLTGTMVYETDEFYDLCDELGILVWHDFMFANMEYPADDPAFLESVGTEVAQLLTRLQRHPSVVVLCGGSEVEQQAAMMGLPAEAFPNRLGREVLATAVAQRMPHAVYVPCSPSGGTFPFSPGTSIGHYYGVGAYRRPLSDARRASVRFASECLAFANVPARRKVDEIVGADGQPGHSPRWKARVPRDRGAGWDFEDIRDHYVRELFGCDPADVRYADPERYLDLGRAAVHVAIDSTISEWRRPGSTCRGALVLLLRDLWAGAGWGIVDDDGRPKSAYDAMARACAPTAVLLTDEGLNGLAAHVVHDRATDFRGTLRVRLFGADGALLESIDDEIVVPAHGALTRSVDALLGGFRDLTYAYRFGPLVYDVVSVQLLDATGVVSEAHYLPGGHARAPLGDLGLQACGHVLGDTIEVRVESERFAHFVSVEVGGYELDANWFHLAPGDHRILVGHATKPVRVVSGEVRALNLLGGQSIKFAKESES